MLNTQYLASYDIIICGSFLLNFFYLSERILLFHAEQWQDMLNNSREEEVPKMNDQEEHAGQKRKHPSSDAKEFQGSNSKESIVIDISDDDDEVEFSAMFSFIL